MNVAALGLKVDSSQVEKGTVSLHQLTGAAGQASAAAQRLAGASQIEAAGQKAATSATIAHTAALNAQHAVMRSTAQQRTMMVYQLNDIAVSLASGMNPAMVAMQQGSQILQGGLMPAVRTLVDLGKSLVVTFWPVAAVIGAVAAGVAGLTYEINKTADAQVGFFDVALAGWQLLAEQLAAWVAPVFGALGSWLQQGWDVAAPILKTIGNAIVGTFVFAFDAIKITWGMLPTAIGDIAYQAADNLVFGVQYMIRTVQVEINKFLASIDQQMQKAGLPVLGLNIGAITPQHIPNPYAGYADEYGMEMGAAATAFEVDYMGAAFGAISQRAQQIAAARGEMDALGGSAKAANDNLKLLDQGLGNITHWTEAFGSAAKSAFSNLGTGIVEAFRKGGDVASNVLNMLMDKVGQFGETLLNNGLNGLLNMGLNALGGLFGGGTWGVAGGFSGFPGIFGIPGMATGGTVARSGLSWVGEEGPELLRLPAGAQIIPNGPSMAMAANQNGRVQLDVTISVDEGGNIVPLVRQVAGQEADVRVSYYDRKTLPGRVNDLKNNSMVVKG